MIHKVVECPFCGNKDLVRSIPFGQTAEVGRIGLKYRMLGILVGVQEALADFCPQCKSIVRLHVAEVDRKWLQRE